jgi:putative membrane protein
MSTVRGPQFVKDHPRALTAVLTVVGYVVVVGTLYGDVGVYPEISESTVDLLAAVISVVNAATVASLVAGWYWIRAGDVERHRLAMTTAFVLILLFLVFYLLKTGGGGRKEIVEGAPLRTLYLGMLGVHIALSMLAVPLVLYAITLGVTHTPAELRRTAHARVGRIAVSTWLVSLVLGVVAYLMLAFYYGPEHVEFVRGMA